MRERPYDPKAAKQTVSITLNSDLYAKVKSLGINASKVAEEALAAAYAASPGGIAQGGIERGCGRSGRLRRTAWRVRRTRSGTLRADE